MKKYLTVVLILITLTYLIFAFIIPELNPMEWTKSTRGGFVFIIITIIILTDPIIRLLEDI